ncbi:hypothetical protein FQN57_007150 [Myotisia sp. PD_48]|nr:hypothetical protein FQN57_007150 [Myotisia sp. PD_48]
MSNSENGSGRGLRRGEFVPASRGLADGFIGSPENSGIPTGGLIEARIEAGDTVPPTKYHWECNLPPVTQQTEQRGIPYENIYSLPLTSDTMKYSQPEVYEMPVPQNLLLNGYEPSHEPVAGGSLPHGLFKYDFTSEQEYFPTYAGLTDHKSPEDDELSSSWKGSPRPNGQQNLTLNTDVPVSIAPSPYTLSGSTPSLTSLSAFSDSTSCSSAFTPCSSLYFSSTPLSPISSPAPLYPAVYKAGSRWCGNSASPNPSYRPSPFLSQRASSSPFTGSPPRKPIQLHPGYPSSARTTSEGETPIVPSTSTHSPPLMLRSCVSTGEFVAPSPVAPHAVSRILKSDKVREHHDIDHFSGHVNPPDLFAPLSDEQSSPPEEDMHPSDPEMIPFKQDLRFENDLYTPRWVRGQGNKREGWCGVCKPGRWLVLKNSAFWYDKSFTHGVSAVSGRPLPPPIKSRRSEGNANIWEGLCGSCDQWVGLVSSKKKGTTWFRHAYKCYNKTNNVSKPIESLKRRRGSSTTSDEGSPPSSRPRLSSPVRAAREKPILHFVSTSSKLSQEISSDPSMKSPALQEMPAISQLVS